jgi:predicted DsbA family dithiol-disulfide isomerase
MRLLESEFGEQVQLDWRSFLLRPRPRSRPADLEKFRAYTQSWLRPAADPDSGRFRVWQGDAGPPSHSVPPQLVAKAAAQLGDGAFRRMRDRLFEAYFSENRDITDDATLRTLWREVELPEADFERSQDPALLRETLQQHAEANEVGATGVPAVQLVGNAAVIVGAHPLELYQRWVNRTLAAGAADAGPSQAGA